MYWFALLDRRSEIHPFTGTIHIYFQLNTQTQNISIEKKGVGALHSPRIGPVRVDCGREFNEFVVFAVRPEFTDEFDTKLMLVPKLSDLKN